MSSAKSSDSLLSLEEILSAVNGKKIYGENEFFFNSVQTDSRLVTEGTLFIPLIGEFQDGHIYTEQACEKGATAVFIQTKKYETCKQYFKNIFEKYPLVTFICVENTLRALQKAAARYVEKFPDLIKCAVTGSSGKTTTKEIAVSILSEKYNVVSNKGNFNSETGLPLSVFNIRPEHEVGIFEMGMNRVNEIHEIAEVLKPKYALITNIGTAHIGILGSRENIAEEKSNVFNFFEKGSVGIIPVDDDFADFFTDKVSNADGKTVYYGFSKDGNCVDETVTDIKDLGLLGTSFKLEKRDAFLKIPGKYNFKNALGAIALARVLNLSAGDIVCGIKKIDSIFGRSQVIEGPYLVVQDCYNANPDSMSKSIEFISGLYSEEKKSKVYVLGDMLELGKDSKNEHEKIGTLCAQSEGDVFIFVGKEMQAAYDVFAGNLKNRKSFYISNADQDSVIKISCIIKQNAPKGSVVLIKASRGIGLERLTPFLQGEDNE